MAVTFSVCCRRLSAILALVKQTPPLLALVEFAVRLSRWLKVRKLATRDRALCGNLSFFRNGEREMEVAGDAESAPRSRLEEIRALGQRALANRDAAIAACKTTRASVSRFVKQLLDVRLIAENPPGDPRSG